MTRPGPERARREWGSFDLLPARIAVFTPGGRRLFANQAWREAAHPASSLLLSVDDLADYVRDVRDDPAAAPSHQSLAEQLGHLLARRVSAVDHECACLSPSRQPLSCHVRARLRRVGRRQVLIVLHDDLSDQRRSEQEVRRALAERETLLREVHHRVKNNLQIISSLLALQLRTLDSESARAALVETRMRVRAIAAVHERLCESTELASLDLGEYIKGIAPGLLSSVGGNGTGPSWQLDVQADVVLVGLDDAVRCGLIVNELVVNAVKHGFKGRTGGRVSIDLRRLDDSRARLTVADDGVGLPSEVDPSHTESLGLHLAAGLAQRLGGELQVERAQGTAFSLVIRTVAR